MLLNLELMFQPSEALDKQHLGSKICLEIALPYKVRGAKYRFVSLIQRSEVLLPLHEKEIPNSRSNSRVHAEQPEGQIVFDDWNAKGVCFFVLHRFALSPRRGRCLGRGCATLLPQGFRSDRRRSDDWESAAPFGADAHLMYAWWRRTFGSDRRRRRRLDGKAVVHRLPHDWQIGDLREAVGRSSNRLRKSDTDHKISSVNPI